MQANAGEITNFGTTLSTDLPEIGPLDKACRWQCAVRLGDFPATFKRNEGELSQARGAGARQVAQTGHDATLS